ncbi:MAG TPA: Rrf2 family transcriptional regulator, partial [Plasticicumulans sp.]|nr:Rrf2 family transcriptional regulator [Plasticicumulans sp.]
MIRISKETDYGIVLLSCLAQAADASLSASALAERGRLPLPTVSKVLKLLARGGLLVSQRGARGGYALARPPREITVA